MADHVRREDRVPDGLPEIDRVPVVVLVPLEDPVDVLLPVDVRVPEEDPEELFDTNAEGEADLVPGAERVVRGDAEEERVPKGVTDGKEEEDDVLLT